MTETQRHHAIYLLFVDPDAPDAEWSFFERALDTLVQTLQPLPAPTHVELFIPPENDTQDVHFATYMGKSAGWGGSFSGAKDFYLGNNMTKWRAVPVFAMDAARRVRGEIDSAPHVGTPYAPIHRAFNYIFSTPPLRAFAGWIGAKPGDPAHCASLTARCLQAALPETEMAHSSNWYGPATLFLEFTKLWRIRSYAAQRAELEFVRPALEQESIDEAVSVLLFGADSAVAMLSTHQCEQAVDFLTGRCLDATASGNEHVAHRAQCQLGLALVRWSILQRGVQPPPAVVETGTPKTTNDESSSDDASDDSEAQMLKTIAVSVRHRKNGGGFRA